MDIHGQLIAKIVSFINSIGIFCTPGTLPSDTFLPGVAIRHGSLIYDADKLAYPGDLLHEAGHLAILKPELRPFADGSENLSGDMQDGAAEMAAIAWSWAAKEHLGLAPEVLFHAGGYKAGSDSLITAYNNGAYVGMPLLQYFGMTSAPSPGTTPDEFTYPKMRYWLNKNGN